MARISENGQVMSLPKPGKRKRKKARVTGPAESSIQAALEAYLGARGLRYLHVPDSVYRLCAPFSKTPLHVKHQISDSLKGVPDIIVLKDDRVLLLELKRKGGKLRQPQKAWLRGLKFHVIESVEQGIAIIKEWEDEGK